ncbi:MAG: helix-turn-helix domain-containing protein [Acidobacteria bacterium]|jgi:transcriptional regulator with XRE-family HTH domain|nr:helix-turn-helix domain-containing protein [Acidobacteriota bacterium]
MRRNELNSNEIGKRLKAVRLKLKLKQKDMAQKIQIEPSYFSQIENGNANPGPEFFVRLASIYKIDLNYLFLGGQEMFIANSGKEEVKEKEEKEVDLDDDIDTSEKLIWLIKNSFHARLVLQTHINQVLYTTDKEIIKKDIERKKSLEKRNIHTL